MQCPRKGCKNEAQFDRRFGILPCTSCQLKDSNGPGLRRRIDFLTLSRAARVIPDRDKHGKDMLQPYIGNKVNPDFFKAYPETIDNYNVKEELTKL